MKIYVSGKISGLERPEVVAKFEAISQNTVMCHTKIICTLILQ